METVGTGLACFVQTMRLVGEWEKGRVEVDIGCSYGAVNVSGTGDKPRSRRTLASVVLPAGIRQEWSPRAGDRR